jgi:hypothetical protein
MQGTYLRRAHEDLSVYRRRVERAWKKYVGPLPTYRARGSAYGRKVPTPLSALIELSSILEDLVELGLIPPEEATWTRSDKPERRAGAWRSAEYVPSREVDEEEFIKQIEKVMAEKGTNQVTLYFTRVDGGVIQRQVVNDPDRGTTREQIGKWLAAAPTAGSDALEENDDLNLGKYLKGWIQRARAGGAGTGTYKAARTHLYNLRDYKCAEGDCAFAAVRHVTEKKVTKQNRGIRRELGLPPAGKYLGFEHLDMLADYFDVAINVYIEATTVVPEYDDSDGENRFIGHHVHRRVYSVERPGAPTCNLYYENQHYSLIAGFNEIPKAAYCQVTGDYGADYTVAELKERLREQGREYAERAKPRPKKDYKQVVLVYDFETIWDESAHNELRPYAVAWYAFDPKVTAISGALEPDVHYAQGLDRCADELLDYIEKAPEDVQYLIVGFNSARFDNFILARAAQNRGLLSQRGTFATGTQLRSVQVGRHTSLDLIKLLSPLPLKTHCANFKTDPVKVDGFDHSVPQNAFNRGELGAWLATNAAAVEHYNRFDVLSTASLFIKARNALKDLTEIDILEGEAQTIGGAAWKAYEKSAKKEGRVKYPAPTKEVDDFFRRAIVGGRVQNFKPSGHSERGALRMVDVASLYPTVMYGQNAHLMPEELMYGQYPVGKPIATPCYVPGKIGFYNVTVVSQPERNVLPRRCEDGRLDWRERGQFDAVTTHCSIELIRRNGGEVIVHDGYYFPGKDDKAFRSFLEPIFAAKDEEDALISAKSPKANSSRREMAKLLMNSLSGKCAQRNFEEKIVIATGSVRQLEAEASMRNAYATWLPLCGETCILIGKKPLDKVFHKRSKPSYMAALIYEYSRAYMYQLLIGRYDVQYMDTDSALMQKGEYDLFRSEYPELDFKGAGRTKRLGDLEEEMGHAADVTAYLLGPKEYCLYDNSLGKAHKAKIKGVCLTRDRLLDKQPLAEYKRGGTVARHELYERLKCAPPVSVFERLVGGEKVNMLCSQLHRAICSHYSGNPFVLVQRFMVKELKPRSAYDCSVPVMRAPVYRREDEIRPGPAVGTKMEWDLDDVYD